jgi:uncharacterized OB-fold protein
MSERTVTHAAECSNRDYDFYYDGMEKQQLLMQRCDKCNKLRSPPGPMCPDCHSVDWTAEPMSGKGKIFTYTVHYHPPLPGFDTPHPVGLIELDEGVRFMAGLDGIPVDEIRIGLPVEADFFRRGKIATVRFRKAKAT